MIYEFNFLFLGYNLFLVVCVTGLLSSTMASLANDDVVDGVAVVFPLYLRFDVNVDVDFF